MQRRYAARAALVPGLLLAVLAAGCSADEDDPAPVADPGGGASASGGASPSGGTRPSSSAGSSDPVIPTVVEAVERLLEWEEGEVTDSTVVQGDPWRLVVGDRGSAATLTGPDGSSEVPAGKDRRITDAFLTTTHAVVVAQDKAETRPQQVTVVDLASGERSRITDPPTGPGGPWSVHGETVAYATYRPGSDYCLATHDLASGTGEKGWCAPKRHGFSNVLVSDAGTSMMTFDAKRPVSCRPLVDVSGKEVTPLEGVPECKGWDVVATDHGHVFSTVPKENQVESGQFFAVHDGSWYALGPGATGTLVWCGDSAYFTRDAQRKDGKAALLRWTPDAELEVVYTSPGRGEAFLTTPSCSGNMLTVTALGPGGDEQVSATVPG